MTRIVALLIVLATPAPTRAESELPKYGVRIRACDAGVSKCETWCAPACVGQLRPGFWSGTILRRKWTAEQCAADCSACKDAHCRPVADR